jgi:DNA polymerase
MDDVAPSAAALLRWYADMGVEEATGRDPVNRFVNRLQPEGHFPQTGEAEARAAILDPSVSRIAADAPAPDNPFRRAAPRLAAPPPSTSVDAAAMPADEAVAKAKAVAALCQTHDALAAAIAAFDGCQLKHGARTTVFTDGVPGADLLVIGEAPGRDEDAVGKPFVGRAGQLLDRMLAAIGRSRGTNTLISNVVYWRPPGNRTPTQVELAICRPFVDRLIEITSPKAVLLAGGAPSQALLGLTSIMRARGVWRTIETAGGARVEALPTLHPAFLLRSPVQKRLAWADLLALEKRLSAH